MITMKQSVEDDISDVLSSMVEDVSDAANRNISGAHILHELLSAPWLRTLLRIYKCLLQFQRAAPSPFLPYASGLSFEIMSILHKAHRPSAEARELYNLLSSPHVQALLSSHDSVAQSDYLPVLPPLPDGLPEDEEAVRIVCLVKNNQPLGATIKKNEETGDIYIARVICGGLADRSGLLHPGDLLVEVNGNSVVGMEPEKVIQILTSSKGTILFKVIPNSAQVSINQKPVYMRAMVDYCPLQDSCIPCPDAGMAFNRGDLLEVVDQSDGQWWQARKLPCGASFAGLIPSASMLKSRQKEQWWGQPLQVHTCIRPFTPAENDEDPSHVNDKCIITDLENNKEINFDELDYDITDGFYLAGFSRSFRLWRRTSYKKRRQSCTSCSPVNNALSSPYEEVALYQRLPQENQRLIILIGASGVGVNELRKRLIKLNPSTFQGPVPHTTRPMKEQEQTGRNYHFVTKELFEYMVCNNRFVEYGDSRGHMYGTSMDAIDEVLKLGQMCIMDVEPPSIHLLRLRNLKPYVIFIKAPSPERLRQTRRNAKIITSFTINRAFTEEDFTELEVTSQLIEAKYKQFFDSTVVNDDLQDACMQLCSIIQQAQTEPQWIPVSWLRTQDE
ncbi:MAGUK p55 subfamily member 4-like [Nematolebias whitei]|uniref:MAGUK p55 subfamily member 4-like n=1 Tax=Nematolebias whitei TaxID=451745 RepID=UPI00189C1C08|nr:MAGUK p55 subfamily member 4-like [Nematolebias whitei]